MPPDSAAEPKNASSLCSPRKSNNTVAVSAGRSTTAYATPVRSAAKTQEAPVSPVALFPETGGPLPVEVLHGIFSLLRSTDLDSIFASSKAAFSPGAIVALQSAIATLIKDRYGRANPGLREDDPTWSRDLGTLRFAELTYLSSLVRGAAYRPGKGYYVSKAWIGNLRRFVEAQGRRRRQSPSSGSSSSTKSKRRGRERAESNLMPPWPDANADIICEHGGLAHTSQATRGKRHIVDKRVWREIAAFFPASASFKAESPECPECSAETATERKAEEAVKKEREQEIALPSLKGLYSRRSGVPAAAMCAPSPATTAAAAAAGVPIPLTCPLLPGIYHLLPRCWLNAWRAYVRDPRAPSPRTLDTGVLLCEGHGLLLAPPHVEEFLSGQRRALLGGLDPDRSGCVCEVLTPEEWDALTLLHPCDFGVRFCVHPENGGEVCFNTKKCRNCDPCYIGEVYVRSAPRKLSV